MRIPLRDPFGRALLAAALVASPCRARAQASPSAPAAATVASHPAVDSAQAARAAWRAAGVALRGGDRRAAVAHLEHAARAWPAQPAYLVTLARQAAMLGDTAASARALERLAALGAGHDIAGDTALATLRGAPAFDSAAARVARNRLVEGRGEIAFTLRDSAVFPEGLAWDARRASWLVSSIRKGTIIRRSGDGAELTLATTGALAPLGIALDPVRRVLWVATSPLPHREGWDSTAAPRGALLALDADAGTALGRWEPADSAAHSFGDVSVGANGDVYLSDTRSPALYRLRHEGRARVPAARSLELLARDPLVRSPQGIAVLPDARALLVADYSHGLLHVALADGGVTRVDEPPGATLLGMDGLCLRGRTLYGVQNGIEPARVIAIALAPGFRRVERVSVLDRRMDAAPEPTLCALGPDGLYYVGGSQFSAYDDAGRRLTGAPLRAPVVVRVPSARR